MCVCVCMCVCFCISLCLCASWSTFFVCVYVSVCLCVCVSMCLCVCVHHNPNSFKKDLHSMKRAQFLFFNPLKKNRGGRRKTAERTYGWRVGTALNTYCSVRDCFICVVRDAFMCVSWKNLWMTSGDSAQYILLGLWLFYMCGSWRIHVCALKELMDDEWGQRSIHAARFVTVLYVWFVTLF